MIKSRTLIAIIAALALTSCEQSAGYTPTPEPTPIDKELAGIRFLSEEGYTQEQIDAIATELLALYGDNDLAGLSDYVKSLTFRPGTDGRSISLVDRDGQQVATIITNSADRVQILGDLIAGRDAAQEARDPYVPIPGPDYIDTNIGGIDFRTAGNVDFCEEQVAAIQVRIDELDEKAVAEFASYIERVTFGQDVEDGRIIDVDYTAGEQATAVIYMEYDSNAAAIMAALTVASGYVRAIRETAFVADNPIVNGQARGGINFGVDGGLGNDQIRAAQTTLNALTDAQLEDFVGYITDVTFAEGALEISIVNENTPKATATIVIPYNVTYAEILATLEEARTDVVGERNIGGPEPFHVFTDGASNELRFYAEAGFDYADALIWLTQISMEISLAGFSPYISSLTLKIDVDGDREIRLGEDGRAIVISNGTDLHIDFLWGQGVARGQVPPTH